MSRTKVLVKYNVISTVVVLGTDQAGKKNLLKIDNSFSSAGSRSILSFGKSCMKDTKTKMERTPG